jgi:hypothetical protein
MTERKIVKHVMSRQLKYLSISCHRHFYFRSLLQQYSYIFVVYSLSFRYLNSSFATREKLLPLPSFLPPFLPCFRHRLLPTIYARAAAAQARLDSYVRGNKEEVAPACLPPTLLPTGRRVDLG